MTFPFPPVPLCLFLVCSVAAQLLLKASGIHAAGTGEFVEAWLLNPWLMAAFVCYGVSFVCWTRALSVLPLSSAYPWTALIYVLTPMAAVLIWREQVSASYLVGMVCILCGIGLAVKARKT
jgi:multidrug transporter EmrE-like cation transporter